MTLVFLIHPNIIFEKTKFSSSNFTYDITIQREINTVLSLLQFTRYYFIFKFFLFNSFFMTPESNKICKSNFFENNFLFIIKSFAKHNPSLLYIISITLSVYSFSFSIRAFERELSPHSQQDFSSFFNALWYALITMTTVGYGDLVAYTTEGRFFAVLACVTGIFLLSMMVITLSNMLNMTPTESRIYDIMHTCKMNENIKKSSEKIVINFMTNNYLYNNKMKERIAEQLKNSESSKKKIKKFGSKNIKEINEELERKKIERYGDSIRFSEENANHNTSQGRKLSSLSKEDIKSDEENLIDKKNEILSIRKNIIKETHEYKLLNDRIKTMKQAVDNKLNNEKFTDFTRHIEQVSNILYSYSILENKQDKLQVEVYEIKKRLEKIFNIISSK